MGIAPNNIGTLFGVFSKARADTSMLHGGLGLDLSIVKKLINLLKKVKLTLKVKLGKEVFYNNITFQNF